MVLVVLLVVVVTWDKSITIIVWLAQHKAGSSIYTPE